MGAVVASHDGSWRVRTLRRESRAENRPSGGVLVQASSILNDLGPAMAEAAAEIGDQGLSAKVGRMVAAIASISPAPDRLAFGRLLEADATAVYRLTCPYCRRSYALPEADLHECLWPIRKRFVAPGASRKAEMLWLDEHGTCVLSSKGPSRAPGVPHLPANGGLQGARAV